MFGQPATMGAMPSPDEDLPLIAVIHSPVAHGLPPGSCRWSSNLRTGGHDATRVSGHLTGAHAHGAADQAPPTGSDWIPRLAAGRP
jgi:hypothetical protein